MGEGLMHGVIARARAFAAPRDGRLSLRANFSWTFLGNVVYAACQWGMLTALAKLGTPELVGQFSLGLAVTAPVMMLANLQLRAIQATDARRDYEFADYYALRLLTSGLALLVIAGIALLSSYRAEMVAVILALGLYKGVQSIGDVYHGLMQGRERMDLISRALLLKGPLALLALALVFYLTRSVAWAGLAMAVVYLAVLLAYERRNARALLADEAPQVLRPRWQPGRLAALAWLALPLGLVMMLISLNGNIPRYAIERYLGQGELGIFAAMASLKVVGTTFVGALGQSASPRLAAYYAEGDGAAFRRLLARLIAIGAGLGGLAVAVAAALGGPVLTLLYTPAYAQRIDVLIVLMVAAGMAFVASFLGYGITAARRFRQQIPLFAGVLAATAVATLVLVPAYGVMGAALALVVSAVVQCVLSALVVVRALREGPADSPEEA
jgi:O-antigen/teichoic acid export membrane protein